MSQSYVAKPLPPLDPAMDASQNHYWTYHSLPALLACKRPLTASQDEDLFIAVHQICELAFHQMILDLDRALGALDAATRDPPDGVCGPSREAVYFLKRVNQLWGVVNTTMPILAGMRAFAEFRTSIGPTSGFQSAQFRRIEIMAGVREVYWRGGTADAAGAIHVAESEFDRVHGDDVARWRDAYRETSLAAAAARLVARAPLDALKAHDEAGPLLRQFAAYEAAQLAFHRAHLGLAVTQLRKVGVETGTGGTSFKTYLATYEERMAPLFPGLATADGPPSEAELGAA
jgi:tryptophan 2,3-dioxygenase